MQTRAKAMIGAAMVAGSLLATASVAQATEADEYFCVIANNVNYRTGPGVQYPSLGQVNYGQGFNTNAYDTGWWEGTMWGGPSHVWIHRDYLGFCPR
jgi:uncharacterized protein YraI